MYQLLSQEQILLITFRSYQKQKGVTQYLDSLIMRIRTMLADTRMQSITNDNSDINLSQWLRDYIGGNRAENGSLTIIDLSLVPSDIIHVITAVIARMVFEALQRYRKINNEHKVLPTVLVMEEAHTFIKDYKRIPKSRCWCCVLPGI